MGDLIKAQFKDGGPVASCPECGSISWHLCLDAFGDGWFNIIGTECTECGWTANWIKVERG